MFSNRYHSLKVDGVNYNTFQKKKHKFQKRTEAFSILSNKDKIKTSLYKTKMCNKPNCNRINCNYAHSHSELKIRKCFFGNECMYKHSKNKMCMFIHPDETIESYKLRISNTEIIKKIIL